MDKLENMFELQKQLSLRLGVDVEKLTEKEKIEWILNYSRAIQQELAELVDSLPWKWWAKYQKFEVQNAKIEVIDILHFVISIACVLGLSADDVFDIFKKKNEINHERQNKGYLTKADDCKHI